MWQILIAAIPSLTGSQFNALIPAPPSQSGLSLSISFRQDKHRIDSTVLLSATFKNNGPEVLFLTGNHLFPEAIEAGPGRCFELRMTTAKGDMLHFWGNNLSEGGTYWKAISIESGRAWRTELDLSAGSFASARTDVRHKLGECKQYRVSLIYNPPQGSDIVRTPPRGYIDAQRWKKKMQSNEIILHFE